MQTQIENYPSQCSGVFPSLGFQCDQAFALASMFCDTKTSGKEMSVCSDPFIHNYLKSRNITNVEAFTRHAVETSTLDQKPSNPATDSIIMRINLQPLRYYNGYYNVSTWYMNASMGSKVCPPGDCQYSIESTQFSPNTYTGGYSFRGLLKVSVVTNDTTNSKFYPMNVDFDKIASQEKQIQTTEFLQGLINTGRDINNPDFKYKVDNAGNFLPSFSCVSSGIPLRPLL